MRAAWGQANDQMNGEVTGGTDPPADLLAETEELYRAVAGELAVVMRGLRQGEKADVKAAVQSVKDLRAALQMVMEERGRVEKLRKQVAAAVPANGLDLAAARDEIGRRLACLRDAARR
ncbi:hypothetical protein C8J27_101258 [Rhodobacter aestuarii]|uniref:Uncharacterized protein n=1 Tax=Rhodobacter aestuarii TaxID=453582 RepID=A0A1N7J5R5_9RHOB|nr:hypothetical protein [Rhodobacter aestuarii]PTV97149.1 hypothetical protein C8J27_101258 [Rhodobacter aestuarii]SIS44695.1 hypothetical protein SAMN05421580_101384 [Rhodobacter aestuarii]